MNVVTGEEEEERIYSVRTLSALILLSIRRQLFRSSVRYSNIFYNSPDPFCAILLPQVRAKLFKLEKETKAWKEKGIGQLHLNVNKQAKTARLGMSETKNPSPFFLCIF